MNFICPNCEASLPDEGTSCPACGEDIGWWLSRGDKVYGPYDLGTLKKYRSEGRLADDDETKLGRQGEWKWVRDVFPSRSRDTQPPGSQPRWRRAAVAVLWIVGGLILVAFLVQGAMLIWGLHEIEEQRKPVLCERRCRWNLEQLANAVQEAADDHEGMLPSVTLWQTELKPYANPSKHRCPATGKYYVFNQTIARKNIADIGNPAEVPLFWDAPAEDGAGPHDGKFIIVFADGHIETASKAPAINEPP